jgi:hypothetical protein
MPKPNPANPYHCDRYFCIKCWAIAVMLMPVNLKYAIRVLANLLYLRRNGKQAKSGAVQYRCKCGFTCTDGDRPAHRPLLGDEPLTQFERSRRYRAKLKANLN